MRINPIGKTNFKGNNFFNKVKKDENSKIKNKSDKEIVERCYRHILNAKDNQQDNNAIYKASLYSALVDLEQLKNRTEANDEQRKEEMLYEFLTSGYESQEDKHKCIHLFNELKNTDLRPDALYKNMAQVFKNIDKSYNTRAIQSAKDGLFEQYQQLDMLERLRFQNTYRDENGKKIIDFGEF